MNAERRKRISDIISKLEELQSTVSEILDEEQSYFDNMPESLQGSDRGVAAEEAVSFLESADFNITEALDALQNIV